MRSCVPRRIEQVPHYTHALHTRTHARTHTHTHTHARTHARTHAHTHTHLVSNWHHPRAVPCGGTVSLAHLLSGPERELGSSCLAEVIYPVFYGEQAGVRGREGGGRRGRRGGQWEKSGGRGGDINPHITHIIATHCVRTLLHKD